MIKVSAVSYLNTKPLLWGILTSEVHQMIDLQLDIPSECAAKLERGEVDLGLVPVAIIPKLSSPRIISDYCIGTVGAVKTVCIYSDLPIEELDSIYLDFHSRTSVELVQILVKEYWKLDIDFIPAEAGFENHSAGKTGALVIGDKAMGMDEKHPYTYDLGEYWLKHTGLPFVFAAWVSNKPLPSDFILAFNKAIERGLKALPDLMLLMPEKADFDLQDYYTKYISYELDAPKRAALDLFLEKLTKGAFALAAG